ncbi:hypothetical protein [Arcicella rosea]|uniref:Uncharacterized protein n=1 Tax=Arcicella rosea TaxID=502909 RepID=A0A841EKX1_9BACT|nr:hypothetical protein [Arcicella rosea]MBB6003845.1 hypothetical protein [Arcicella rosea]
MGLFNSAKSTTSLPIGSATPSTTTTTPTKTTETNSSSSTGGSFLDVIGGIFGASGSGTGSNKTNTGSGDPASSIVSSLTNVASAWINGDANKQVAKLNVEAEKLMAQAEASKADQALYDALKAQAETKTNEATQLANRAKSNNITNWLLVASVLALAFGIIYLVFKAVFGWTSSKKQNPIT